MTNCTPEADGTRKRHFLRVRSDAKTAREVGSVDVWAGPEIYRSLKASEVPERRLEDSAIITILDDLDAVFVRAAMRHGRRMIDSRQCSIRVDACC